MAKLSVITPCYFNEQNIPVTVQVLLDNEQHFPPGTEFEYVLVDDGSKDDTWGAIERFRAAHPHKVVGVKLAANVGSFNAILAGMNHATGDVNVMLTADLQDPPELIPEMFSHWEKGLKLVIANRTDRPESFASRTFSRTYHRMIRKYALPTVPKGGFDLVLFDKALREQVVKMDEKNTNVLYLLTWLGYPYVSIPYARRKREIGKSRWTLKKKIKMFIDSFVAFSFWPLRMITVTGFLLGLAAVGYGIFLVIARSLGYIQLEGWTGIMVVLLFVSSFQMISLGILGEYLWRTLDASRKRPNFVVDQVLSPDKPQD